MSCQRRFIPSIAVDVKDNQVLVARSSDAKAHRALHGLWRALIQNMITGVTTGYSRKLELVGVGYRVGDEREEPAAPARVSPIPSSSCRPEGVKMEAPTQTSIMISGIDKALVGQVAAKIRSFRPPEPYKGKGIKYEGEYIRRKAGKAAAASGAKA